MKSDNDLPDSIWDKIQRAQILGGISAIKTKLNELYNSSNHVKSTLHSIEESLLKEENLDNLFRQKFAGNYNLESIIPSIILQRDIRDNINKLKEVFHQAQNNSDKAIIIDIFNENSNEIKQLNLQSNNNENNSNNSSNTATNLLLNLITGQINSTQLIEYEEILTTKNKFDLWNLLSLNETKTKASAPIIDSTFSTTSESVDLLDFDNIIENAPEKIPESIMNNNNDNLETIVHELEEKLCELAILIESRDQLLSELNEANNNIINTSIDQLLNAFMNYSIENNQINSIEIELQTIIDRNVTELTNIANNININIQKQDEFLKNILNLNKTFQKLIENDPKIVIRNNIIEKIEIIIAKVYNWFSQLNGGITFYSNLQVSFYSIESLNFIIDIFKLIIIVDEIVIIVTK